jgi:polyphosphate kinase
MGAAAGKRRRSRHLRNEGLKTHSKVALVVRQEGSELRRYVHIATGNYNPTTSKHYTDVGLLTADEEIGATRPICLIF